MLCAVLVRHSSGVLPLKRGPDADIFSSIAQVKLQWSTMMSWPPTTDMASASHPLSSGWSSTPVRTRIWRMMTSWVAMSMPDRIRVMPGEGAVWPAMVR